MIIRQVGSRFIDASALTHEQATALTAQAGTNPKHMDQISVPLSQVTKQDVLRVAPLTAFQEACCVVFLGFVGGPSAVILLPLLILAVGYFVVGNVALTFRLAAVVLVPLVLFLPQSSFSPRAVRSWMTHMIFKYFSYKMVLAKDAQLYVQQDEGQLLQATATVRPQIYVAPPHGVYPFGTVLSLLFWPVLVGHHFFGLSASAALRTPLFGHVLRAIGCIDAGRQQARHALEHWPYTIGMSSGGVAEVFEANARNHECILLKERVGLVKLAIRTGADLVPVYLFGNTQLLSCWLGEGIPYGRTVLEWISRKVLGFAAIPIFGRFIVPIPYRKPVLCVIGKPIPTFHLQCQDPTFEQVAQVQSQLIDSMQTIFDEHKGLYGWDDVKLIIK